MSGSFRLLVVFGLIAFTTASHAQVKPPRVVDSEWSIELILSEPDIFTPVACVIDQQGRLLVIESHTHFPPDDYAGPKTDRILMLSDSDGDGSLDNRSIFYEGGNATMGLAMLDDGWIAVATRRDVAKLRDSDGDGRADQRVVLAELKTAAEYPHNGLAGLAVGPDGNVYFGQGENFGEAYELVAAGGEVQVGSGEGGSIFRMTPDGRDLQRVATGFWNPFGICFDSAGRLWTVGNDPDAMPPCRLIHVVEGGDYGFEFRFGRGGTHPLQSWFGQLPGTLPPTAGTGEAPCAVLPVGDRLWVTSWGDNRVEAYRLQADGASWKSETETIVQGDSNFRPVGIVQAGDGSVYITDWVKRDYAVHRTGRVWRLKPKSKEAIAGNLPTLTPEERHAERIAAIDDAGTLLAACAQDDPFLFQAAVASLSKHPKLETLVWQDCDSAKQQLGLLAAWRWKELVEPAELSPAKRLTLLNKGIESGNSDVQKFAARWAAERNVRDVLADLERVVKQSNASDGLFEVIVASISYLQHGTAKRGVRDPARDRMLYELASDQSLPFAVRSMAVRMIPGDTKKPTDTELLRWVSENSDLDFQREIVRLLDDRGRPDSLTTLSDIAFDPKLPATLRADAVAGLSDAMDRFAKPIESLTQAGQPDELQREARRVLRTDNGELSQAPAPEDVSAWLQKVGQGGDPAAGHRVFRRSTCITCHAHSGRGASTGPDLSNLSGQSRQRLLQSILQPSQEIGPLYVPWKILTTDGEVMIGLKTATPGVGQKLSFQAADGSQFLVALEEIDYHSFSDTSIMPDGLEKTMSISELRDLLAFLQSTR